ncbi:HEXXH motif domain-containing protein [Streptomyces sp. S.PNR 29]|uniref:HEXXH motif domain-containing protein n=1 Tax=Streptomyces sp. S.PNR 29 TaxID=2973805 RepID=UPI0025B1581D|nr:HEXXH motif domain-containing protein [Streptomyces sp. S.PNR 29]MDN0197445.1 HEXXH motif domain-containing protein [Streptomyces sp. S.PNR 29]
MTSAQRHAPFRMPEPLFAELAAGGGSAEALAFLERGERARRLLLLRTLLARIDALPTPLTPAAEAWHLMKEAAARAPEPVDRLLLAPTTGGWVAHMLRRVHGTATGPPLWAEAGHLCALAVTASLHAGTETTVRVPLTDGGLHLPGLGLARLPDAEGGLTVGLAGTRRGELTLTGPGRDGSPTSVTCRPTTAPLGGGEPAAADPDGSDGEATWLPLRTLTHTGPAGTVAIPLDDLDPYRDLDDPVPPARLDADEAGEWQRVFDEAVGVLTGAGGGGDGPGRLDPAVIRAVVPWGRTRATPPAPPTVGISASSGDSFGSMVISRPATGQALAETLVHEFQHSKLGALLHLFPLLDDDREERYYAPWRADPRHLTGLLHGAYAFTGVTGFWRDRMADPAQADAAAYHFALRRLQTRLVVRTLLASGRLTAAGRRLVGGLAATLDGWLREPVDPAALARARTAAALHRTEWRLRNVVPEADAPAAPRFRTDRPLWPDLRTHAFATRPAAPHTPDEHLAAGNPAAALDGYADSLARDPADPHLLAGWIVARAALDRGHATRRLLARPELLQPQPSG